MDTLYATFGSGNCFKAHLAYHQLQRPHAVAWVDVLAGETRKPAFLEINPNGTVPFLLTATGHGIAESNAIAWHIARGTWLAPENAMEEARTIEWMIFEQTRLEPFISPARFYTSIVPHMREDKAEAIREWQERGAAGLDRLNRHLAVNDFIAGSRYCVADIAVFGYTHVAGEGGFEMERYPAIRRWIRRVEDTALYSPILEFRAA